jgi:hypothetical protein
MKALPRVRTRTSSSNFHGVKISELQFNKEKNQENINLNILTTNERKSSHGHANEITKSNYL